MAGLSNEQSAFLRAFRRSPAGPPPGRWPTPRVLRRWLNKTAFREALSEIRRAVEFQTNLRLTAASIDAAAVLAARPDPTARASGSAAGRAAARATSREQAIDLLRLIDRRANR
jgi:DNA-directed RNA polymerase specialized sigma24 family protein